MRDERNTGLADLREGGQAHGMEGMGAHDDVLRPGMGDATTQAGHARDKEVSDHIAQINEKARALTVACEVIGHPSADRDGVMKQQGYEAMARENEGLRKAWAEATEAGGRARAEVARLKEDLDRVARAVYPHKPERFTYSVDFMIEKIARLKEEMEAVLLDRNELLAHYQRVTAEKMRLKAENERLREVLATTHKHTQKCLMYSARTGVAFCIAECADSLAAALAATPQPSQDGDDAELLDWLEATQAFEVWEEVHDKRVICIEDGRSGLHSACTLRDAIRAAIRRQS